MPAGMRRATSSSLRYTPKPWQVAHFSFGTFPFPRQMLHVVTLEKLPKIERFVSCIFPRPLQVVHVSRWLPFAAPLPPQLSHLEVFARSILRSVPKIDSENGSSISTEISRPRVSRVLPPAKNSPKISPKSKPSTPAPLANPEKSKPPKGPCPAPPDASENTRPYESYSARFLSSESTLYASFTSLNLSVSPPFLSG